MTTWDDKWLMGFCMSWSTFLEICAELAQHTAVDNSNKGAFIHGEVHCHCCLEAHDHRQPLVHNKTFWHGQVDGWTASMGAVPGDPVGIICLVNPQEITVKGPNKQPSLG